MSRSWPCLISGGRVVDPFQGLDRTLDLFIDQGKVAWLGKGPLPEDFWVLDAQGLVVSPGFIDLHCHLGEPGLEERETLASGTRAAARGGFTTVCLMPDTQPPIDHRGEVEWLLSKARQEGVVRVLPVGCITKRREGRELVEMAELAEAGVVAFSDDGNPLADAHLLRQALTYGLPLGRPLIQHCEEPSLAGGAVNEGWVATRLGLKGTPAAAEEVMAARDIRLARLTGGRLHLAHISTAGTVELVRRAKEEGVAVTAEVTPHHLTLGEEWVLGLRGQGHPSSPLGLQAYDTQAKVTPPLRGPEDRKALVQGLREGVIDAVATDHRPRTWVEKMDTYPRAASGISGLETALGSLLSLVHEGALSLATLIQRLTVGPARVLGLPWKGLAPGEEADITLLDPQARWTVDPASFFSKGKNTPLEGCVLQGKVVATFFQGALVYKDEACRLRRVGG